MRYRRRSSGLYLREGSGIARPGRHPFLHPVTGIVASGQLSGGGGGGGGYGWAPTDVTGLLFWFRSDAGVTLKNLGGGDEVDTIADQSGNGFDVTMERDGVNLRVTLQANATAGFNEVVHAPSGLGWARLVFDDADPFNGTTAAHLFWGVRWRTDPPGSGNETGMWYLSEDDPGGASGETYFTDGNFYGRLGSGTRDSLGPTALDMTQYRCIDVQCQSGANGYQFHIDGNLLAQRLGDGSNWVTAPKLGQTGGFPTHVRSFDGFWLDWFMYDHVLTGADLTAARTYCTARFDGSWTAAGGDG